jgi:SAM-dependent methyltransferase
VTDPNAAQSEYWNAAHHWVDEQDAHDAMLEPLGRLGFAALAPAPGERILDIGCGTGTTTLELGATVAPDGEVVGADISAPLLERARSRAREGVRFIQADAQTYAFDEASFDGAFSRFGVMFFADPTAAFANIRRALRHHGRLAFVCWRDFALQDWMRVPAEAAGAVADWLDQGPNPFAFADAGKLEGYLAGAGFVRITTDAHEMPILVGGPGDAENAMRFLASSRIGRTIREQRGDAGIEAARRSLEPYTTERGVEMQAAVWVVRAEHG